MLSKSIVANDLMCFFINQRFSIVFPTEIWITKVNKSYSVVISFNGEESMILPEKILKQKLQPSLH